MSQDASSDAAELVLTRTRGRMQTAAATAIDIRAFPPLISDEPPSRGGEDSGPTPMELVLAGLCGCTNVTAGRMAAKLRFAYTDLEASAVGELDIRGRKGTADVPVHWRAVRLEVRIATDEPDERIARLADLVGRYCPVDSLIRAAVEAYEVTWTRM